MVLEQSQALLQRHKEDLEDSKEKEKARDKPKELSSFQ